MILQREIIINKNVADSWHLLGPRFADIYLWASTVNHTEPKGEGFNGATCSERGCETAMGAIKEKILQYSEIEHLVKFDIYQGLPAMVKKAIHTWQVISVGNDKSKFILNADIQFSGFMGMMMQPIIKIMMGKMFKTMTEDFKYYVENDKPNEAKIKAIKKYKG